MSLNSIDHQTQLNHWRCEAILYTETPLPEKFIEMIGEYFEAYSHYSQFISSELNHLFFTSKWACKREEYHSALKTNQAAFKYLFLEHQKYTPWTCGVYLNAFLCIESVCHLKQENTQACKASLKMIAELNQQTLHSPTYILCWACAVLGRLALQRRPNVPKSLKYSLITLNLKDLNKKHMGKIDRELKAEACINVILAFVIDGEIEKSKPYQIKAVLSEPGNPLLKEFKKLFFCD